MRGNTPDTERSRVCNAQLYQKPEIGLVGTAHPTLIDQSDLNMYTPQDAGKKAILCIYYIVDLCYHNQLAFFPVRKFF